MAEEQKDEARAGAIAGGTSAGPLTLPAEAILGSTPVDPEAGEEIGRSRRGRPIRGFRLGSGELSVSLIGGCHADEPVGPETLRRLVSFLGGLAADHPLLAMVRWSIVPHVNPDGAAANAPWAEPFPAPGEGFELARYLTGAVREPPGDDVEFGFPHDRQDRAGEDGGARPENRAVAAFLAGGAPFDLHATLHGMAFAAGPWFLLEASWAERTAAMRERLRQRVRQLGYRLHDIDRGGEKGFTRIDEGFTTRPDSGAMRRYFEQRNEPDTAALFRPSSMEHVRSLGGDPLTLVSEMPLFLYDPKSAGDGSESDTPPLPVDPPGARAFVAHARARLTEGGPEALAESAEAAGVRPMPVGDQMRLQLAYVEEALVAVELGG